MADIDARVHVVLIACVHCSDGEDFLSRVGLFHAILIILDESRWKFRDGAGGDVPVEASRVNKRILCGQQDSTGPTIYG